MKLTGIDDGSAIPIISLIVATSGLLPPQNQVYFEKARDSIVGAISAAEGEQQVTRYLPESFLGYFDRIGRSLRDGEAIEFNPSDSDHPARLTRATRRRLILASSQVQELTEEVRLRGGIPEMDQEKMTFTLQLINGVRIVAPFASQHLQTVLEGFNGYRKGVRILLQGIGRYNRFDRLQSIETAEHVSVLDPNDIAARLDEFLLLKNGWLNGKGVAPDQSGLDWLGRSFEAHYPDDIPLPFLYPTAEGGVQAEWSLASHEMSLDVVLQSYTGEWHDLNLATNEEAVRQLNLHDNRHWNWIVLRIRQVMEVGL
jgi:hypothetical protein